jgi:single-stranded DNA-binding protein
MYLKTLKVKLIIKSTWRYTKMTNFVGNISKAAVTRTVMVSGVPTLVTDFNVAENYRGSDGTPKTQFYRVTLWRDRGAKMAQYLTLGRAVAIEGRVKGRAYLDKNNTPQCQLEISNPKIQLIGKNIVADEPAAPAEELPPVEEDLEEEDKPF